MSNSSIKKCDSETKAKIEQVFRWILSGQSEHDIAEAIAQQWPETEHKPLIVAAVEKIRASGIIDSETVSGWCFEATRDLYRRMVEIGDFSGALKAIKQISDYAKK